jgi:hypothetical protein
MPASLHNALGALAPILLGQVTPSAESSPVLNYAAAGVTVVLVLLVVCYPTRRD